jgi:hypothetical protein
LKELDGVTEAAGQPWSHQLKLLQTIPGVAPKGGPGVHRRGRWGQVPGPVGSVLGGAGWPRRSHL